MPRAWARTVSADNRGRIAAVSRIKKVIETLEAERDEVRERLAWLDDQIDAFREDDERETTIGKPPARSKRRATARRASKRRHAARSLQQDTKAKIVTYLEKHPGSTAGDIAKGLNIERKSVADKLAALARAGEIKKSQRGYVAG
jgi:hypothetical protein